MSGHSRWAKLKHFKGALDAKKSAIFTKFGHGITVAARQGGGDPETNFRLRLAIEQARRANLPKENIERAIKRGTGGLGGEEVEEIFYEVIGPSNIAIVVEALTDNKNRTISNLRRILNRYGFSLGQKNSVLWMFERYGILRITNFTRITNLEDLELKLIEAGIEDIKKENGELTIYTKPGDLQKIKEAVERDGTQVDYAGIEWFAKNPIQIDEGTQKKVDALFAELDEDPDINDYYSNIE